MNPLVLKYGALGLGFALAVLTYRLLLREQAQTHPRPPMLVAIYVYMGFSLLLAFSGFIAEAYRQSPQPAPGPAPAPDWISLKDGPVVSVRWTAGDYPPLKSPSAVCSCFSPQIMPPAFPVPHPDPSVVVFPNRCTSALDVIFVKSISRGSASPLADPFFARIQVPANATATADVSRAVHWSAAVLNCPK